MNLKFLEAKQEFPLLYYFNIDQPFFNVFTETLIATVAVATCIVLTTLFIRYFLRKKQGAAYFCIVEGTRSFMNLCEQTLGEFSYKHFAFILSLFIFVFFCNAMSVIPYIEEPTVDLNTALALALISFLYRESYAIKTHGLLAYLGGYLKPIFFMAPLNIMGKLSSLFSMSFRLFGNTLGGSVVSTIYMSAVSGTLIGALINFSGFGLVISLFFGLFEGFVQAFIFSILSLTYIALAVSDEGGH